MTIQCDAHRRRGDRDECKRRAIAAQQAAANEMAWRKLAIQSIKSGHYDIAKARIEAAECQHAATYQ